MKPKVTVLVAVYNAKVFLSQCLDSLQRQSLRDIQVVCIDDGSTDDSLNMLQEYAERDSRFEVLHLDKNVGQAHARNVGLQQATGEIVCMLDADDWLSDNALELLYKAFDTDTDAVLFNVVRVYSDRQTEYQLPSFDRLTGQEAFRLSLTWQIHGLYGVRTAIHKEHPYDEACRAYSDDNTTRIHYLCSRQVRRSSGIYYYRQHSSSVTHQVCVRRFDYLRANESMRFHMQKQGIGKELLDLYENCRWFNLIDVYMFFHVHGHELSSIDRLYGLQELHRVWSTIDRRALKRETITKFGYRPCCCWTLFRLQEWFYFTFRGLLGKNH